MFVCQVKTFLGCAVLILQKPTHKTLTGSATDASMSANIARCRASSASMRSCQATSPLLVLCESVRPPLLPGRFPGAAPAVFGRRVRLLLAAPPSPTSSTNSNELSTAARDGEVADDAAAAVAGRTGVGASNERSPALKERSLSKADSSECRRRVPELISRASAGAGVLVVTSDLTDAGGRAPAAARGGGEGRAGVDAEVARTLRGGLAVLEDEELAAELAADAVAPSSSKSNGEASPLAFFVLAAALPATGVR